MVLAAGGVVVAAAALVNPTGPAPEAETATLLNTTLGPVDLTGWTLLDRAQHPGPLPSIVLTAGDAVRLPVPAPFALGNNGGTITLLDARGLKVRKRSDACREYWTGCTRAGPISRPRRRARTPLRGAD